MAAQENMSVPPKALTAGNRHPHPLFLLKSPVQFSCEYCKCDGFGQRYVCKEKGCKGAVHVACATLPDAIDNFFLHPQHQLTLQSSNNPFTTHTCEACGGRTPGHFYRCKPCSFELHPFCSVLSNTIHDPAHPGHPLTFQPPGPTAARSPCSVCGEKCGDQKYGGTYCCGAGCAAQVHVRCLSSTGYPNVPSDAEQQTAQWKATKKIKDTHHPHPLVLRRNPVLFKCDRCKCPGYGPRYRCRECKVSIHETCATCPETISFFMHPEHPLVLNRSYNPFNNHTCEVCGAHAHGYFYRCKSCSFELHPFCSHLQPTITDAAHPGHTLRYDCAKEKGIPCSVCGKGCDKWSYSCEECGAHLHMGCLEAASEIKVPSKDQEGVVVEGGKKGMGKKALVFGAMGAAVVLAVVLAALGEENDNDFNFDFGEDELDVDFGEDEVEEVGGEYEEEEEEQDEEEEEEGSDQSEEGEEEEEKQEVEKEEEHKEEEDSSDQSEEGEEEEDSSDQSEEGEEEEENQEEEKEEEQKEEKSKQKKKKKNNLFLKLFKKDKKEHDDDKDEDSKEKKKKDKKKKKKKEEEEEEE